MGMHEQQRDDLELELLRQRNAELEEILSTRYPDADQAGIAAVFRREAILEAIGFAAERFLRDSGSLQENMGEVLARLGTATGVSRVYIFENSESHDGTLLMNQRHEWATGGVEPQIDNPELQRLSYGDLKFGRWQRVLSQGDPLYGLVRTFPAGERETLEPQDIISIVVVPIFVEQRWWGFIGFDDCQHERSWSVAEIDALRAAGGIIGSAIQQDEIRHALSVAHEQLRGEVRILSSPLLPITNRVLLLPLIGSINEQRAEQITETLLDGVATTRAIIVLLDLTGVSVVDLQVADMLVKAAKAVSMLGSRIILTGINPAMAQELVVLGINLRGIATMATLQQGVAYALMQ